MPSAVVFFLRMNVQKKKLCASCHRWRDGRREMFCHCLGSVFRAVCVDAVKKLHFVRHDNACKDKTVLVLQLKMFILKQSDFEIIAFLNHMEFDRVLDFVAFAGFCDVDWYILRSQDLFLYFYKTDEVDLVEGTAPMMRTLLAVRHL